MLRMNRLTQALDSVRDRTSLYWAFYDPEETIGGDELVEVRLDGPAEVAQSLHTPEGWDVHRVERGETVYLRRYQPLTDEAVEAMLIQMLEFAGANGMQLHSWLHGGDVN